MAILECSSLSLPFPNRYCGASDLRPFGHCLLGGVLCLFLGSLQQHLMGSALNIFAHEHPELDSKLPQALLKHFVGSEMERQESKC